MYEGVIAISNGCATNSNGIARSSCRRCRVKRGNVKCLLGGTMEYSRRTSSKKGGKVSKCLLISELLLFFCRVDFNVVFSLAESLATRLRKTNAAYTCSCRSLLSIRTMYRERSATRRLLCAKEKCCVFRTTGTSRLMCDLG